MWWFLCCEQYPTFLVWKTMQNLHTITIHHKEWLWLFAPKTTQTLSNDVYWHWWQVWCNLVRWTFQNVHTFDSSSCFREKSGPASPLYFMLNHRIFLLKTWPYIDLQGWSDNQVHLQLGELLGWLGGHNELVFIGFIFPTNISTNISGGPTNVYVCVIPEAKIRSWDLENSSEGWRDRGKKTTSFPKGSPQVSPIVAGKSPLDGVLIWLNWKK